MKIYLAQIAIGDGIVMTSAWDTRIKAITACYQVIDDEIAYENENKNFQRAKELYDFGVKLGNAFNDGEEKYDNFAIFPLEVY